MCQDECVLAVGLFVGAFKDFKAGEQQFGSRVLRSCYFLSFKAATGQDILVGTRGTASRSTLAPKAPQSPLAPKHF